MGGFLTDTFGWQSVFWINPPVAVLAVGILAAFAPQDRREPRAFDVIGAAILASALGSLAWALSQIGPSAPADAETVALAAAGSQLIGIALAAGVASFAAGYEVALVQRMRSLPASAADAARLHTNPRG